MDKIVPQVGDVVFWVDSYKRRFYKPDPPYVIISQDPKDDNFYLECLDGRKIMCGAMPHQMPHQGVSPGSVRVDPFLTAAHKAIR